MRAIKTSLIQQIVNKANSKNEFTTNLNNSKSRYIVSQFNIYTGTNPSICFDLILRVEKIVGLMKKILTFWMQIYILTI